MTSHQPAPPNPPRRGKEPEPDTGFPRAIGRPATSALHAAGYTHLDQLADVLDATLLALHGFGPKAMRIIREMFAAQAIAGPGSEPG